MHFYALIFQFHIFIRSCQMCHKHFIEDIEKSRKIVLKKYYQNIPVKRQFAWKF